MTCSNVTRDIQRQIYDERRRVRLTENDICLIEFPYTDFNHRNNGKLVRGDNNVLVIRNKLRRFRTLH